MFFFERLPLSLFMLPIRANDSNSSMPTNQLTFCTNFTNEVFILYMPDHELVTASNLRKVPIVSIFEMGYLRNASVGERSALEGSNRESGGRRSGSENVGLSNENIGENPMPRKPKVSSKKI